MTEQRCATDEQIAEIEARYEMTDSAGRSVHSHLPGLLVRIHADAAEIARLRAEVERITKENDMLKAQMKEPEHDKR